MSLLRRKTPEITIERGEDRLPEKTKLRGCSRAVFIFRRYDQPLYFFV